MGRYAVLAAVALAASAVVALRLQLARLPLGSRGLTRARRIAAVTGVTFGLMGAGLPLLLGRSVFTNDVLTMQLLLAAAMVGVGWIHAALGLLHHDPGRSPPSPVAAAGNRLDWGLAALGAVGLVAYALLHLQIGGRALIVLRLAPFRTTWLAVPAATLLAVAGRRLRRPSLILGSLLLLVLGAGWVVPSSPAGR